MVAGIGGTLLTIQQQSVSAEDFSYESRLAFVVIVVTTGVSTVEGAINAGIGFVVIQQLLTYLPARLGGNSLVFVLFAFGAIQYAAHPEGVLEFQKRRWTLRMRAPVLQTGRAAGRARRGSPSSGPSGTVPTRWRRRAPSGAVDAGPRVVDRGYRRRHTAPGGRCHQVVRWDHRGRATWASTVNAGESVGPGRAQRRRQDHPVQLHLRADPTPAGERRARGPELLEMPIYKRARLGIGRTYQRVEIFPDMTVRDHLLVAERARRGEGRLWKDLCNRSSPDPRGDRAGRRGPRTGGHRRAEPTRRSRPSGWVRAGWSNWPGPW